MATICIAVAFISADWELDTVNIYSSATNTIRFITGWRIGAIQEARHLAAMGNPDMTIHAGETMGSPPVGMWSTYSCPCMTVETEIICRKGGGGTGAGQQRPAGAGAVIGRRRVRPVFISSGQHPFH